MSRPTSGATVRARAAGSAVALVLVLTGCATAPDEVPEPAPAGTTEPTSGAAVDAPGADDILALARGDRTDPPTELEVTDLTVGSGAEAVAGTRVVVQYLGVRWSDGGVFDTSWTRERPFTFDLGARQVIDGWDRGVVGMRVGGRRLLVIPPALAYGDRGAGGVIGPGETLIFAVDLLEVG